MQAKHIVEDCPVCGRPVEAAGEDVGRTVNCGHCDGRFIVSALKDGRTATDPHRKGELIKGEDRLLRPTAVAATRAPKKKRPIAVVAEPRDEVFARLAADLAESGMQVVRAQTASEALRHYARCEPALMVANVDLPDQSAWLLAGKLRFVDPNVRIWIYQSQSSPYERGMASFLKIDELLTYGGDLLGLAETLVQLVEDQDRVANSIPNSEVLAAA